LADGALTEDAPGAAALVEAALAGVCLTEAVLAEAALTVAALVESASAGCGWVDDASSAAALFMATWFEGSLPAALAAFRAPVLLDLAVFKSLSCRMEASVTHPGCSVDRIRTTRATLWLFVRRDWILRWCHIVRQTMRRSHVPGVPDSSALWGGTRAGNA